MKAVLGELYFLEKSLIFVAKQPTVVDYADIHQVVFSRCVHRDVESVISANSLSTQ